MDVLQDIKRERGLASTVTIITREHVTFETADHKEATMSFKEKRKPEFGQSRPYITYRD
jgi:enoyl-CoA hydratase